jgi:hypothetical protein
MHSFWKLLRNGTTSIKALGDGNLFGGKLDEAGKGGKTMLLFTQTMSNLCASVSLFVK